MFESVLDILYTKYEIIFPYESNAWDNHRNTLISHVAKLSTSSNSRCTKVMGCQLLERNFPWEQGTSWIFPWNICFYEEFPMDNLCFHAHDV